jgi:hypothetical protein
MAHVEKPSAKILLLSVALFGDSVLWEGEHQQGRRDATDTIAGWR